MPKHGLDKDIKKAIFEARSLVEEIAKADSNEADTRKRVVGHFEIQGYRQRDSGM